MTRRIALVLVAALGVALAAPPAPAQTPGVTATEIKIGNTNPYSGNASAYGTIGRAIGAYMKKVNEEGGINGRKINYISYDDGYSPPKTVEMVRKLVEQDQVALLFQTLGTPTNTAIHKYMNQQKVPHLFVATGATKWNDPKTFPWTMGWQPNYQTEGEDLRPVRAEERQGPEDRHPLPERRLRQGLPQGPPGRPGRRRQEAGRAGADLRGDRPDHRFPDRQPQEQRGQRLLQHQHSQVRRPGDQEGARHRLEAPAPAQQRVQLARHRDQAGGGRGVPGADHRPLHEGDHRPPVVQRPGLQGLGGVDEEVLPGGRPRRPVERIRLHAWPRPWSRC